MCSAIGLRGKIVDVLIPFNLHPDQAAAITAALVDKLTPLPRGEMRGQASLPYGIESDRMVENGG